jgi:hypothetical protein
LLAGFSAVDIYKKTKKTKGVISVGEQQAKTVIAEAVDW